MGYNQTKMANIRPKSHIQNNYSEENNNICQNKQIKAKIYLIGQNQPIKVKIDLKDDNQIIKINFF